MFSRFVAAVLIAGALAVPASFALDSARPLNRYVHESWGTDDGLPQPTVRAIVQTRDGYLWLGTDDGLARFDGVRFTVFDGRNVAALRSNAILALLEDRAGNLWIGTHGGGLTRYRDGAFSALTHERGLTSDFVYALHEDRAGILWIGARRGVTQLDRGKIGRHPELQAGTVWSIEQDRAGTMWLGSDLNGLTRIERGVVTHYDTRTTLPHDAITVIRQLRDGRVVIGTNGAGLYEWNDGRFVPFRASGTLPGRAITALLEDASGNLWIGTNVGLARATRGVMSTGAPGELAHVEITAITEDAEGSLWIGTNGAGLHRLREGKAQTLTTADGLPGDMTQSVMHDRDGNVWVGTRDGAARIARDGSVTTLTTRNGLPNHIVKSLFQSSDGAIWLGTDLGGVVRITAAGLRTTILDPNIPDNTIRAFAEDREGGVWVGTNGGPLTRFTNGVPSARIDARPGMPRLFVRAMASTAHGSLWIATDGNGLVHLRNGELVKVWTEADGLSRDGLRSLYIDRAGTVWIGTDGGGLNRLRDGRITAIQTRHGLFDDLILQIIEGDDGRLWMSSHRGVFAVDKRAIDAFDGRAHDRVSCLVIDDHDGMRSRDCSGGSQPAGAKSSDGRLWFPTNDGVAVIDPRELHRNSQPPPVHIERVVAERNVLAGRDAFELPRGTKLLEISYTALSLVVPERVRFRYKLEGYDDDWIDAGARRTAYYTALRPGRYRFRVIAANDDGVWSERGATASINLRPYFYQRPSFVVFVLILLIAAVWTLVALRIRRIRDDAARDAELKRRMEVVERMEALGQMASGIAHDFNNTLMAAYPWAEALRREYPNDARIQQAANSICGAVERAKNVTHQLLDFAQPKLPAVTCVNLGELAANAVSMARATIPPEIDIRLRVEPRGVLATGDEAKLAQVLLNLLLNARDAMPGGGAITVDVRHPDDANGFVLLSVSDTGSGIDPAIREHIFDPFFTTKAVGKGTGLGLAVVHRIVEDHRGTIRVESAPGKGTTFHVLLPEGTRPARRAADEQAAEVPKEIPRGTKVLLIDDEAIVIEVLRDGLERASMRVESVTSGLAALRMIDDGFHPDIVILDLGLPEMPGEEVHAHLRARFPELPIIISSGYGDRGRLDPLLRDAHTAYFQKPYRMELLLRQIATMI